jgi:hypothetical protein
MKTLGDYVSDFFLFIEMIFMVIYIVFRSLVMGFIAFLFMMLGIGVCFLAFFVIAFFFQSVSKVFF